MNKRFKKFRDRVFHLKKHEISEEIKKEIASIVKIPYTYTVKFISGSDTDFHQKVEATITKKETANHIAKIYFSIEKQPHCCSAGVLVIPGSYAGIGVVEQKDNRYLRLLMFFDGLIKCNENFVIYIGGIHNGNLIKDLGGYALATPKNKKIISVHSKSYESSDISLYSLQIKGHLYKQDYSYSGVRTTLAKRNEAW